MKTFHRTEIRVVVLSEEPLSTDTMTLEDVAFAIGKGDCVGEWDVSKREELTPKQAADALISVGSEPGFFQLNEDGTDAG